MKIHNVLSLVVLATIAFPANAIVIEFEEFAAPGALTNINPSLTYMEDGFTITPTNDSSAVFDSAASSSMIGNNSDWFGFAESNNPSLTLTAASNSFNLNSVVLGPSTIAASVPIDVTVTANFFAGGSASITYSNLSTATLVSPGFSRVASVNFLATDDAGLDNIDVHIVPESATASLASAGLLGFVAVCRRTR
jgi:hypothetical protein